MNKQNINIPFNKPYITGQESNYINQAVKNGKLSGDGQFTHQCQEWLQHNTGCEKALLTQSCTAALDMAAILIDTKPGDEIIMPSFTFVSTANAFVLRGATPVFVDIRPDTLNIDETKIEAAITKKTKAIVPMHYAGVGCEMDTIMDIAEKYNLFVIEDAAQGIMAKYQNKPLGSIGHLGTFSFHDTKNIISGEGGALLVNSSELVERAEIIREKGTNRSIFLRGEIDKYTWVDIGSSYLPSEITAAFLLAQLENAEAITKLRLNIWEQYHTAFQELENNNKLRRPIIPENCQHNAHMYYLLLSDLQSRTMLMQKLKAVGINTASHYVPLHTSIAGKKFGRANGNMTNSENLSESLLRMPFWPGLEEEHLNFVINNSLELL